MTQTLLLDLLSCSNRSCFSTYLFAHSQFAHTIKMRRGGVGFHSRGERTMRPGAHSASTRCPPFDSCVSEAWTVCATESRAPTGQRTRYLYASPPSRNLCLWRFSLAGGCAITVPPWNMPGNQGRHRFCRSLQVLHLCRVRRKQNRAQFPQLPRTKILRGIVPSVPSGWNRGAANWSARCAAITCLARTITDMLCGSGPVAAGAAFDEERLIWHSR
jgi:hypothetical protein